MTLSRRLGGHRRDGGYLDGPVSVMIDAGMNMREAAVAAMQVNRTAGKGAQPTPATQIEEIIRCIPSALRDVLGEEVLKRLRRGRHHHG